MSEIPLLNGACEPPKPRDPENRSQVSILARTGIPYGLMYFCYCTSHYSPYTTMFDDGDIPFSLFPNAEAEENQRANSSSRKRLRRQRIDGEEEHSEEEQNVTRTQRKRVSK